MNARDDGVRPNPGAEQRLVSGDDLVERQVKQYQAEFLGGRRAAYYAGLAHKLEVLVAELETRPMEGKPQATLERLRGLLVELQEHVVDMKESSD